MKEKEKLILLESSKIFIAVQFLLTEETECLTEYGLGLVKGLLDPDTGHKIPMVHRDEYDTLKAKYDSQLLNNCLLKEKPSKIKELQKENNILLTDCKNYDEENKKLKQTIDNLRKPKKKWYNFLNN